METQLATSCKEGQSSQWIRLALVPENETDGFNPSLITVLKKDGKLIRLDQLIKLNVRKNLHRVITVSTA